MIDKYAVQDFLERTKNSIMDNKKELSKNLAIFGVAFLLGALLNYSCSPSSTSLARKLQDIPKDIHPTRVFYEDKVDVYGRPNPDGIVDQVLIYDQYGGRKEILPGYIDKQTGKLRFRGREQD